MVTITFIALLLSAVLLLISDNIAESTSRKLYFAAGVAVIILAGFRNGASMPDYSVYQDYYYQIVDGRLSYFIEISFIIIAKISNFISNNNPTILFLIYACLGVGIKMVSIKMLTNLHYYSLFIYLSNYFILQEMIQIRAGVATAFILLSIIPLYHRNRTQFIGLIILAGVFHYSTLIYIVLWFINPKKYNKVLIMTLVIAAYMIYLGGIDPIATIIGLMPFNDIYLKLLTYTNSSRSASLQVNVFGAVVLSRIMILIYFSYFSKVIVEYNKYFYLLIQIYALGIIFYIAFAKYPDIAVRSSYTLLATEIIIIPTIVYTTKGKYFPIIVLLAYGVLGFVANIYFTSYFIYAV